MAPRSRSLPQLNIALAAEEAAGLQALRRIAASTHRLRLVLTSPARGGATAWQQAHALGVPALDPSRVKDPGFADELRAHAIDLLINVHALYLIDAAVLAAPLLGALNLHPGPLPRYAGLNTPCWAIWHGEREFGVSLHWLEPTIDAGPVAYQELFPVAPEETGLSLYGRCARAGIQLLDRLLADAAADPAIIPRRRQDLAQRTFFRRAAVPNGGCLSLAWPAARAGALVRAACFHPLSGPWGVPRLLRGGERLGIVRAAIAGDSPGRPGLVGTVGGRLGIKFADGWLVPDLIAWRGTICAAGEVLRPGELLAEATPAAPA